MLSHPNMSLIDIGYQGALVGLLGGLVMSTWMNIGQQVHVPWVEQLDTNVYNCTLPANTTIPPLPQNP